ncbi:hypothetical protein PHYBOEH_011296 [Phytophthora boehmeriae]|uniref:Vacuolar protein 8 n=1 Tax=Phytophthora boehmeriae TaxID=109152 RepID=A0A8T1WYG1_9STRA|nr:hypothetical protein PHYBOEH_011296 [Phytophthora boehmeriae]
MNASTSAGMTSSSAYLIKATYNVSLEPIFHGALLGENIPRFLAVHLPIMPPVIQGWALRAFVSLGELRTNRQLLLTPAFCQLLKAMLVSPSEEIQEITLVILLQLSMDEGSRIKICNWLPISSLVAMTNQHISSDQQESKAQEDNLVHLLSGILRNLCDSVLTHHELIQEGSVPVLLKMSRMIDPTVQVNAVCALCYLISSSTDEVATHIPELTELLLTLSQSSNMQDCIFAVESLYNISCCDDSILLLCESEPLLDRLIQLATDPVHKKVAEGFESRLIEQGAIQAVMVLALVATDSVTIKALCIMTLANCLVDVAPQCLQSLIDHGIIWALSSLCTLEYPEVSYVCAVSLCNLSANPNKALKFLDAGAPRALIHLLSHTGGSDAAEDAEIVLVTVKTIANLVANEKLCLVFLNEGLEKHLSVHFSSPESSEELRQLTAMVLLRVTSANDAVISPERFKLTMLLWMEQIIDMKDEDLPCKHKSSGCTMPFLKLQSSSSTAPK